MIGSDYKYSFMKDVSPVINSQEINSQKPIIRNKWLNLHLKNWRCTFLLHQVSINAKVCFIKKLYAKIYKIECIKAWHKILKLVFFTEFKIKLPKKFINLKKVFTLFYKTVTNTGLSKMQNINSLFSPPSEYKFFSVHTKFQK